MKKKFVTALAMGLFMFGIVGMANAGKIVVNHDEWTFDNTGFSQAPDAEQFAVNIASWFTGGSTGNFLAYSSNHGLTESLLASTMTNAGHYWTVSTTVDTLLSNLLQYDE